MKLRNYLLTSYVLFSLFAVVHIFRLIFRWHVNINQHVVPMWVSVVAIIVAETLAVFAARLRRTLNDSNIERTS